MKNFFVNNSGLNAKFIIRLKKKRNVSINEKYKSLQSILDEAKYPYKTTIRMKRKFRLVELYFREIKISGIKEKLYLIFTKNFYGVTYILITNIKIECYNDDTKFLKYLYRWSVEDFFRAMKQELEIDKIMVRTLRRINNLIEIAMLAYTIAFKILILGGQLVGSIIEAGGKLGIKKAKMRMLLVGF